MEPKQKSYLQYRMSTLKEDLSDMLHPIRRAKRLIQYEDSRTLGTNKLDLFTECVIQTGFTGAQILFAGGAILLGVAEEYRMAITAGGISSVLTLYKYADMAAFNDTTCPERMRNFFVNSRQKTDTSY